MTMPLPFATQGPATEVEQGLVFQPKFGSDGLIPAIVSDTATGEIVMFAWMNAEALALTIETRVAHFYSRSRGKLWKKGEESGNQLNVTDMRTDCDQDVIALRVHIAGAGAACHTGAHSCFYRLVPLGQPATRDLTLKPVEPPVQPVVR